jgi:hypothetical protein
LNLLVEVDLSHNSFTMFPMQLTELPHLLTLRLNKNGISELPMELRQLRSLSYLNLDGCPIKKAPPVLGHMCWADVEGCLIPQARRAAYRFKITQDDEEEIEQFLRHRAASRKLAHLRRKSGGRSRSVGREKTTESSITPSYEIPASLIGGSLLTSITSNEPFLA